MRRVLTATMLALGLAASTMSAAQAKDGSNMGAERMASFVVGTVVGTPINMIRGMKKDYVSFYQAMVGKSENTGLKVFAATLCFPCGVVNGMMSGIGYAPLNAWKYSAEAPFSKETFSLGKAE
jgi:hypothetical protein